MRICRFVSLGKGTLVAVYSSWGLLWRRLWPAALGTVLGLGYYLTLWRSFVAASHEAGGWIGFWRTLGAIALPFACHCALPAVSSRLFKVPSDETVRPCPEASLSPIVRRFAQSLLVSASLAIIAVLALRVPAGPYPFPRVFLPLLPAFTFATVALCPDAIRCCRRRAFVVILALVAILSALAGVAGDLWNRAELRRGAVHQNLLVQYYRGDRHCQPLARYLMESFHRQGRPFLAVVPSTDGPSVQLYCALGMDSRSGECWYAALPPEWLTPAVLAQARLHHAALLAVAESAEAARQMLQAPPEAPAELLQEIAGRRLWRVIP